jgi:hypothetical protein
MVASLLLRRIGYLLACGNRPTGLHGENWCRAPDPSGDVRGQLAADAKER